MTGTKPQLSAAWAPSIYFVIGQAGWFASVMSAARGFQWLGVMVSAALITLHLWRVTRPVAELKLIGAAILIGGTWETFMVHVGWLQYPSTPTFYGVAPLWLLGLWGMFAAQFNTTYKWLKPHVWIAVLLGAVAGPLSFRAGAALGALEFVRPVPAVIALVLGWSVLLPTVLVLSRRWDGVA